MTSYNEWMEEYGNNRWRGLVGKTFTAIEINDKKDCAKFACSDGSIYSMHHTQDCCESVSINDIVGDLEDLIGSPIVMADVVTSNELPKNIPEPEYRGDSETWTFYKIATNKGSVTIRWYGSSNGYYSESVDFVEITKTN